MKCPQCLEESTDGSKFCPRCGGPLPQSGRGRRMLVAAVLFALLIAGGIAVMMLRSAPEPVPPTPGAPKDATIAPAVATSGNVIHVGIAYGTEKRDWFTWAVAEFSKTPEARGIQIDLLPMGSLEAAQAIAHGDKLIQVWSPASALYKNVFLRDWSLAHPGENPVESEQQLALTPMVLVMWQQRFDAFVKRYPEVTFSTISQAMSEPGGWNTIAGKPEWGFFKFSHTQPNHSNSGLVSLVLMAYDYHGTHRSLNAAQITDPKFQQWLITTEQSQVGAASGLIDSTGTLMNAMVQRGWSTYDCVMVYEANAIDRLRQANGRWGQLRVVYPKYNFWNDNPYYVLNVPWSNADQRHAAAAFAAFLLGETAQRQALLHGFRPANVNVPTNGPDSPFVQFADVGLQTTVPGIFCEPPDADALETLLLGWQRPGREMTLV